MKNLQSVFIAVAAAAIVMSASIPSDRSGDSRSASFNAESNYTWARAKRPKTGCWPDCREGEWCWQNSCGRYGEWPMTLMPVEAWDKLWMVGNRSTWASVDGLRWTHYSSNAAWGQRYGMETVFFRNKLWKMGGMERTWDNFKNDVWSSSNGVDWTLVTPSAAWSQRRGHSVIMYQDRMWVLGGSESSGRRDQLPSKILDDVWSSVDGKDWVRVTEHSPWSGNDDALVFQGKIWVIGRSGVWHSTDGQVWTEALSAPGWMDRSGNGCLVFDEKVWVLGGLRKEGTVNDVWSSSDGIEWQKSVAPWSPRGAEYSVVFHDKLWIFGGKTGRQDDGFSGDVWQMQ
ncbi:MAG: hypothetical protein ACREBG_18265 [Pyrinomonadaceae bacterium]